MPIKPNINLPGNGFRAAEGLSDTWLPCMMVADNTNVEVTTSGDTVSQGTSVLRACSIHTLAADNDYWVGQAKNGFIAPTTTFAARFRGSYNTSVVTSGAFFAGFAAIDTSFWDTDSLVACDDYIGILRASTATELTVVARKAGGTLETTAVATTAIAINTWIDYDVTIVWSATGAGTVYVSSGVATTPGGAMTSRLQSVPIVTQFPDTVLQVFTVGAIAGAANVVRFGTHEYAVTGY